MASIHDYAALEIHPLASLLLHPEQSTTSRAEYLRSVLRQTIERLRPTNSPESMQAVGWRPYAILYGRYVEGLTQQELQDRLSLSARQLTREHARALSAVVSLLHGQVADEADVDSASPDSPEADTEDTTAFTASRESLSLDEVLRSVLATIGGQGLAIDEWLALDIPDDLPPIQGDRIVLRQILFALLGYIQRLQPAGRVTLTARARPDSVDLEASVRPSEPSHSAGAGDSGIENARFWAHRFGAVLRVEIGEETNGLVHALLSWPRVEQSVVMVVDDQEPAIRLFRRYLSQARVRVVGVREPEHVVSMARLLRPTVITLDVMMPTMDGWEVLQSLLSDPSTRQIPVVVCSVWDEPDLARSFGAAGFLKKPISQADLLSVLQRLGVLDRPAGLS